MPRLGPKLLPYEVSDTTDSSGSSNNTQDKISTPRQSGRNISQSSVPTSVQSRQSGRSPVRQTPVTSRGAAAQNVTSFRTLRSSTPGPSGRTAARQGTRKKPRKSNPYKKIHREIMHYQKSTQKLIPKAPFGRLVRETLQSSGHGDFRITAVCFDALQEAAEMYLTQLLEDAYRCTLFRRCVTLHPKDIQLVRYIRGGWDPIGLH
ncbi:histone H3-like [Phlebotomus argentipes]|uniref:histone H3-like n=1 Tax=Phlebotomus argentipes TaxID=94469 RepID=UPI0028932D77|nr:histone H3-like [Phlebotomus argentipes]